MRNLSYENEFCVQFHFHANQSHFHKNGFALRLALKQRHKGTRKWPILEHHDDDEDEDVSAFSLAESYKFLFFLHIRAVSPAQLGGQCNSNLDTPAASRKPVLDSKVINQSILMNLY